MKRHVALWAILSLSTGCAHEWHLAEADKITELKGAAMSESKKLKSLGDQFWQHSLSSAPIWATFTGDRRYDHLLPDISPRAMESSQEQDVIFLHAARSIKATQLNVAEQNTLGSLIQELSSRLDCSECQMWTWAVDQLDGPQITFAELPSFHSIRAAEDVRTLASRYTAIKDYYAQHIENLQLGLSRGLVSPEMNIRLVIRQLDQQLSTPANQSPYYEAANHFPAAFSGAQKTELSALLLSSIQQSVYPSLRNYRDFLQTKLLKKARKKEGLYALSIGENCYRALIKFHTGFSKSPDEIHSIGLSEAKRIKGEMSRLAKQSPGHPSLNRYLKSLKDNPHQYASSKDALIRHNERLVERASEALPRAFGRLPITPIEVRPIEAFRDREAPAGYYYEAPSDGSRPAFYYLNASNAEKRPLYNMSALAFHEAVPGHHLQIALANENKSLPDFQRKAGHTAFVEGWALYAESLAGDLGLYDNDEQRIGALNYELWRALRLVVDTGIHHKGWSRQETINYLAKETALPKMEVTNEVDRYIIGPGQALAYKIGQLEILVLRNEAKAKLKEQFDLSGFHDHLLAYGAIPLKQARKNIEAWVKEQEILHGDRGLLVVP